MIKKFLTFEFKYKLKLWLQKFKQLDYFKSMAVDKEKNQAYIFLAADYGNLGDVAITYAQKEFLKQSGNYEVIEIPISKSIEGFNFVKRNIKKSDVLTIVGGGNMGDMYNKIEFIRQMVIKIFPENKIISFPQTVEFSNSTYGQKKLMEAQKVYNRHQNFHMIGREATSFKLMREYFKNVNVISTPDIVLSLNRSNPIKHRKGAVICMRNDKEKKLTDDQNKQIIDKINSRFSEVTFYDTHIGSGILNEKEKYAALFSFWETFKGAELVVTDRLHGMIFCHITDTPCLVFQNSNHKVRETYEWIKENKNITLIQDFDLSNLDNFLAKSTFNEVNSVNLDDKYQKLRSLLT